MRNAALSPDGSRAYVTNRGDGTLSVIDVRLQRLLSTIHIGQAPAGVAFANVTSPPTAHLPIQTASQPTMTPTTVPTPSPFPQGVAPVRLPPGTVLETFVPEANYPSSLAFAPDGRLV